VRARPSIVLLCFIGIALALGAIARSASGRAPSFAAAKSYRTGNLPLLRIADLNGDGKPDLVTANDGANTVSVLLNAGDGRFPSRHDFATGRGPVQLAVADLNGDGKPDLLTGNFKDGTVSVLLNSGDGSFAPKSDFATGVVEPLAVADLNGDGKADLAIGGTHTVSVLLNRGDGSFSSKVDFPTIDTPASLQIADLNADGKPDLVTTNIYGVSVLLNRGDRSFRPGGDYATADDPGQVEIADLNGDGKPDLAAPCVSVVSVLLNRGDGTFRRRRNYEAGDGGPLKVADLNGDGKPDLAITDLDDVSVLLNRGDGSFGPWQPYSTGHLPSTLKIADMNGDGKPDLTTSYERYSVDRSTISVLLNDGRGHFLPRTDYRTHGGAYSGLAQFGEPVRIADLNGDGRRDVVTSDSERSLSVLINTRGLCNVQDVKRVTVAAAKRKLARVNCRVGTVSRSYSKWIKKGRVISQKPRFGAVRPGGAKVNLVVSLGRKH
jgi:hypothetical protein